MNSFGPGIIPGLPTLPGQNNPVGANPNAEVISLPEPLQDARTVLLVRGSVSATRADNTVTIDTPQGPVEVKLSAQTRLSEGQNVEIVIQPGRPPQNARVDLEAATPRSPREVQTTDADDTSPRTAKTPIDVALQRPEAPPLPRYSPEQVQERQAIIAENTLPPDTIVRLESIPTDEVAEYIRDPRVIIEAKAEQIARAAQQMIAQVVAENLDAIAPPNPQTITPQTTITQTTDAAVQARVLMQSLLQGSSTAQIVINQDGAANITLTQPAPLSSLTDAQMPLDALAQALRTSVESPAQSSMTVGSPNQGGISISMTAPTSPFDVMSTIQAGAANALPAPLHVFGTLSVNDQNFMAKNFQTQNFQASITMQNSSAVQLTGGPAANPTPTSTATPLLLSDAPAGSIMGTVIGHKGNLPVVQFTLPGPGGGAPRSLFFVLHAPANLIPGTEIAFTPQLTSSSMTPSIAGVSTDIITNPAMGMPAPGGLPLAFFTPDSWPLMNELHDTLMQASPLAALAFSAVIPNASTPAQMTPAILFFIAAVRGGDMTQWLGERATDILRRDARGNLLARLSSEGSSLSRMMNDPVSQDWRAFQVPLYWDGEIYKIGLHYRHEFQDGKDGEKGQKQVRFVFDLALDQMGKVQLDGLFRAQRLDLIIRTQQALSQPMQMRMRQAYINALAPTEVKGELSFQNKPEQWVTIQSSRPGKFGTSA